MNITIEELCNRAELRLYELKYMESTINEYRKGFRELLDFSNELGQTLYTSEVGKKFINGPPLRDNTNKNGFYRIKKRKHLVQLFDEYVEDGCFHFEKLHTNVLQVTPATEVYIRVLNDFVTYLRSTELSENTIQSYRTPAYHLLDFFERRGLYSLDQIQIDILPDFINSSRDYWKETGGLRNALCGLRAFSKYIARSDLYCFFSEIRSPRSKHIIPVLTENEQEKIWVLLESNQLSLRNKAIVLLSLTSGIRASDIVAMRLRDLDWANDCYSFIQTKTGNSVTHPLLPAVGNAIINYILYERPKDSIDYVFLRSLAPYHPLSGHASVYNIIKHALLMAGVSFDKRICGTTLLRHNVASSMLHKGVRQEVIASVLGHADPDTTSIYISTDEERLRKCVLPVIRREAAT